MNEAAKGVTSSYNRKQAWIYSSIRGHKELRLHQYLSRATAIWRNIELAKADMVGIYEKGKQKDDLITV